MTVPLPRIIVAAAVVERDGSFLVTRRLEGSHLEGCWEFPGGKCDPGETHEACLAREMMEELDAGIEIVERIMSVEHEYPGRIVELHFFKCTLTSDPRPLLGQDMQWVSRQDLRTLEFPAADERVLQSLITDP
jgi:8-oxo-dGTP diphosphatase